MHSDGHLSEIMRIAREALIETGAVSRCERHEGMLIDNDNAGAKGVAYSLAAVWIKKEVGNFKQEDLRNAVISLMASAGKDGCSACAKLRVM